MIIDDDTEFSNIEVPPGEIQDFGLDPQDPKDKAFIRIDGNVYLTNNLSSSKPTWIYLSPIGDKKGYIL